MRIFKKVDDTWCIQETTRLFGLTLTEQGKITAPEGKQVTLVYNGENLPLLPGQYEGDVVLEVTDTLKYQDLDFRAAVVLENGKHTLGVVAYLLQYTLCACLFFASFLKAIT